MSGRLGNLSRLLTRHPLVTLGGLAVTGLLLWYGYGVFAFRQARSAARQALAEYDFDEARRQLARCIELAPADAEVRLLAAQTARRAGDLGAAAEVLYQYEQLAGTGTQEGELEYLLLQAQRGHLQEVAKDLMAKLEIRHPASEQILEALAVGCVHVYHLDVAAYWLKHLSDKSPKNAIGRLLRAQVDDAMGRRDRRLDMLRALAEDYPAYAEARLYLAGILLREWQYEEAVEHYQAVRRRQPAAAAPLLGLAQCYQRLDRTEEVRPLLAELEQHHSDRSEVLLECGRFALAEKRFDDAERLLRRAVALAPNDPAIHRELGACLHHTGKQEESERHLERSRQIETDLIRLEKMVDAMSQAPADPAPRLEAGQICLRNGDKAEALRWLLGALEIAPNHSATHAALADYFTAERDVARAAYHRQRAAR